MDPDELAAARSLHPGRFFFRVESFAFGAGKGSRFAETRGG
jgi:hypothetical protein